MQMDHSGYNSGAFVPLKCFHCGSQNTKYGGMLNDRPQYRCNDCSCLFMTDESGQEKKMQTPCRRCDNTIVRFGTNEPGLICNECFERENADLANALRELLDAPQGSTAYYKVWQQSNEVLNRATEGEDGQ